MLSASPIQGLLQSVQAIVTSTLTQVGSSQAATQANTALTTAQSVVQNLSLPATEAVTNAIGQRLQSVFTVLEGPVAQLVSRVLNSVTGNDSPVIGSFDASVAYTANSSPVDIDSDATVTDADSANFQFGWMSVRITQNLADGDVLGIRNVGTGAGQIGVSGSQITYGGVTIGRFAGGTNGLPLTVFFNDDATPAAVQALLRSVTFSNSTSTPSTQPRTVQVLLTDGDGGLSQPVLKAISVT